MIPPTHWHWDGEALRPRYSAIADKHFVVGERYIMVPHEERSMRGHRFFFAAVNEAWKNLPEVLAERFRSADHLRKHALIACGYRSEQKVMLSSEPEAYEVAKILREADDYAIVIVENSMVIRYTAKSQSLKAMGKKDFQESKTAVLDYLSNMIGVVREELETNAGEAA